MMATVGILAAESCHLATPLPAVLLAVSAAEVSSVFAFESPFDGEIFAFDGERTVRSDHVPGDIGFDPLSLRPESAEDFKVMQTKELQNGRLGMLAVTGIVGQEIAT